ncbi:MAG: TVP38/TMEM64 family protein [Gemmatimonadaceae bacterium]
MKRERHTDWLRLLAPLVVLALFALAAWKLGFFRSRGADQVVAEAERVAGRQWLAPIFIVVYAALTAIALPMTMLTYAAGAVFGVVRGSIYVWIATMIGAVAAYYLARGLMAKTARRLIGPHRDKLRALKSGRHAALTVFRMQLTPMLPFAVVTYAAGSFELSPLAFFTGTAIGIVPGTLVATFVGDRFVAGVSGHDRSAVWLSIAIPTVLLGLSFVPKLVKSIRRS